MGDTALLQDSCAYIPKIGVESLERLKAFEQELLSADQVICFTQHSIHAGVYCRTLFMPKGTVITGALVKRSTNIIVSGHVVAFMGDNEMEYEGYAVLHGSAQRKQLFRALEDTYLTMFFATQAKTVAEAEEEFTDEAEMLASRRPDSLNHITITGE